VPEPEPEPARPAPRVAVVVATNRGGPFLEEALRSVVAQTLADWELVVVDDGATDAGAVRGIVDAVDDPRVRLLRIPASGVSRARDLGVEETSGGVLAFLDDDDRWDPRRLELGVAPFDDPDVVATYCGLRTIDAVGNELAAADQREASSPVDVAAGVAGVLAPNVLVRRTAFDAVGGFDARLTLAEDLDLLLGLARRGRFAFVPTTLVDYRYHQGNTTRRYRDLADAIRVIVRERREEARAARDEPLARALAGRDEANDRFAAWSAARAARASWRAGERRAAVGDLVWAARFAPRAPWLWLRHRVIG
jgi:glycosyltransferase involved in cell wall biosynthesis